tara:strand:- start:46 stop:945 length:900 start_codon:yes stop_codon:yes gene_type:complete
MTTPFDFSSVADLGTFWDGSAAKGNWGGGQHRFNKYDDAKYGALNRSSNLDTLYQNLLGRNADSSGRKYWSERLASGDVGYQDVINTIKASDEWKDQQTAIAGGATTADELKSLDSAWVSPFHKDSGSNLANWQPGDKLSYSQAYSLANNFPNWQNKTVGQVKHATGAGNAYGGIGNTYNTNSGTDTITGGDGNDTITGGSSSITHDPRYDSLLDSFNTMQNTFSTQLSDLQKAYAQSQTDMQNMWDNVQWDMNRTNNPQVRGVRTQNELPGFRNRTGGTRGYFGRGSGNMLKTSSLNI